MEMQEFCCAWVFGHSGYFLFIHFKISIEHGIDERGFACVGSTHK